MARRGGPKAWWSLLRSFFGTALAAGARDDSHHEVDRPPELEAASQDLSQGPLHLLR